MEKPSLSPKPKFIGKRYEPKPGVTVYRRTDGRSLARRFLDSFNAVQRAANGMIVSVGSPTDNCERITIGDVIRRAHVERVEKFFQDGLKKAEKQLDKAEGEASK